MKKRNNVLLQYLFIGVFSFVSFVSFATKAPITTIASIDSATSGEQIKVPVKVSGFNNIGGFTLALDYEYAKLQFVSGNNNSLLGGTCNIGDIDLGNGFHRLTISWYNSAPNGVSLADESSIVEYVFTFISGPATLSWFDMGPSCVYNDPGAHTLDDTPTSDYYFSGLVTDKALQKPIISASGPITFQEGTNVTLTSSAGLAYLWSTGDTTSSIIVNTTGIYSVQITDTTGIKSEPSEPVEVNVIEIGTEQLEFRLANPKILKNEVNDYLEFDVQLRADSGESWLWTGQINLNFNGMTLSSKKNNWKVSPDSLFVTNNSLGNKKYEFELAVSESVLIVDFGADDKGKDLLTSSADFVQISNEYLTLVSVKGLLISNSGNVGIEFNESEMNGNQFRKISEAPWYESYQVTNYYDPNEILDITDLLTNLEYEERSESFKVFTNNNNRKIVINGNVGSIAKASLYDMQGSLLITKELNAIYQNEINIAEMNAGIYLLQLKAKGITKSFKVIIKN